MHGLHNVKNKVIKTNKALNTQFKRDNKVEIHPDYGFSDGDMLRLSSEYGSIQLEVKLNEDIRHGCLLVTNNTLGVNMLTPSIVSDEGENACFQEVKITVEKV